LKDNAGTGGSGGAQPVDLLPMLDVSRPVYTDAGASPYIGAYTRLYIDGDVSGEGLEAGQRRYSDEDRGLWRRAFIGRTLSRVLTVKATVEGPNFSTSRPLASASQVSNRTDGEVWDTELSGDRLLTRYFRIGPMTTVSLEFRVNTTASIDSTITSDVLEIIKSGVALAAPTSSLVTTLNEDRFTQASDFVDDSVSRVFGEAMNESAITDVRLNRELETLLLTEVSARFPGAQGRMSRAPQQAVGSWAVRMDTPIVSIFSAVPYVAPQDTAPAAHCASVAEGPTRQACAAFEGISPHTILGFEVGDDTNLMQSLLGDTAVQTAMKALADASTDAARAGAAHTLCNAIAGHVEGLGFNRFDEAAAVWAFARAGSTSTVSAAALLKDATVCAAVDRAYQVKLPMPAA
jgi:hypothetical protein